MHPSPQFAHILLVLFQAQGREGKILESLKILVRYVSLSLCTNYSGYNNPFIILPTVEFLTP